MLWVLICTVNLTVCYCHATYELSICGFESFAVTYCSYFRTIYISRRWIYFLRKILISVDTRPKLNEYEMFVWHPGYYTNASFMLITIKLLEMLILRQILWKTIWWKCAFRSQPRPLMYPVIGRCPFCENYAKFYSDAKSWCEILIFWCEIFCALFFKSAIFG